MRLRKPCEHGFYDEHEWNWDGHTVCPGGGEPSNELLIAGLLERGARITFTDFDGSRLMALPRVLRDPGTRNAETRGRNAMTVGEMWTEAFENLKVRFADVWDLPADEEGTLYPVTLSQKLKSAPLEFGEMGVRPLLTVERSGSRERSDGSWGRSRRFVSEWIADVDNPDQVGEPG